MGIETLEKQHRELLGIAGQLLAALPEDEIPDAAAIKALLVQLLGRLTFHLTTEDEQVYPLLLQHQDAQVRAVAARFQRELFSRPDPRRTRTGTGFAAVQLRSVRCWHACSANGQGGMREWRLK